MEHQADTVVHERPKARRLPQPVHAPDAGGPHAEYAIMQQRAEMLGSAQDLRLRQARVIVFNQRQRERRRIGDRTEQRQRRQRKPGTHYAVAALISDRAFTIAARYWRARSSMTSKRPLV